MGVANGGGLGYGVRDHKEKEYSFEEFAEKLEKESTLHISNKQFIERAFAEGYNGASVWRGFGFTGKFNGGKIHAGVSDRGDYTETTLTVDEKNLSLLEDLRKTGVFHKCFGSDFPPVIQITEMGGYSDHSGNDLAVDLVFHNNLQDMDPAQAQQIEEKVKDVWHPHTDNIPAGTKESLKQAVYGAKKIYKSYIYHDVEAKLLSSNYEYLLDSLREVKATKIAPYCYDKNSERSRANNNQLTDPYLPQQL